MKKRFSLILMGLFLSVFSSFAYSGTIPQTFQVTANIVGNCTAVTAADMAFGAYNPLSSTPLTSTSTIGVTCNLLTPYTIALNVGTTTGASFAARLMNNTTNAGNTLQYNLYTSNTYTTVWGDGTSSTATVAGTGLGVTPTNSTVYGQVPASQNSAVGNYSDTITATVTY